MREKLKAFTASKEFDALLRKLDVFFNPGYTMSKEDLLFIIENYEKFKPIDEYFRAYLASGTLPLFLERATPEDDAELVEILISSLSAYVFHCQMDLAVRQGGVADPEWAKKVLGRSKILDLVGKGSVPVGFTLTLEEAQFEKIALDTSLNVAQPTGESCRVFSQVDPSSPTYQSFKKSLRAVVDGQHSLLGLLDNTQTLAIYFDQKSDDTYEVGLMISETDWARLFAEVGGELRGYFDLGDQVFKLGLLSGHFTGQADLDASITKILTRLFKFSTNYSHIYIVNSDTLYLNEFKKRMLQIESEPTSEANKFKVMSNKYS